MATQIVEFGAPAGQTITAKLFMPASDTLISSVIAIAAINRTGVYTATYTNIPEGLYRLIAINNQGVLLALYWVDLKLITDTYIAYDIPISIIQHGTSTLTQSDIRGAIGLGTANLDEQLENIQNDTNDIQSRIPAELIDGKIDSYISPEQIRGAIGLGTANLNEQLENIQNDTNDIQSRIPAELIDGMMIVHVEGLSNQSIELIQNGLATSTQVDSVAENISQQIQQLPSQDIIIAAIEDSISNINISVRPETKILGPCDRKVVDNLYMPKR